MKQIQTHPTVVPGNGEMITEAVRGNGAILVNKEGKRFINELQTRDVVSAAELKQTDKVGYLFFDNSVRKSLKAIETYIKKGLVTEGKTPEELAQKLGINADNLKATLADYAKFQTRQERRSVRPCRYAASSDRSSLLRSYGYSGCPPHNGRSEESTLKLRF